MIVLHSFLGQFDVSNTIENIEADLVFPKLVVVLNNNTVYLRDIRGNKNEFDPEEAKECIFTLEEKIIHRTVQGCLLWILLKSHEIIIIDLKTENKIHVSISNYKIRKLCCNDNKNVLFISESGEHLIGSLSEEEIHMKLKEKSIELSLTLGKTQLRLPAKKPTHWNGFLIQNENQDILLKCPITGVYNKLKFNVSPQYILPWDETIVVSCGSNMWIQNLQNANFIFKFPDVVANYFPVKVCSGSLYYLTWEDTKISVHTASSAGSVTNNIEHEDYSNETLAKLSSQETLKLQLQSLVDITLLNGTPEQVMSQLQTLFINIEDYVFLINIATKLCNHNFIYKSILYTLQNRIYQTGDNELIYKITELVIKIDLLEYICFKGNTNYNNVTIYDKTFVQLCILFLSKCDLDLASICWLKYIEIKQFISSEDVNNILYAVPFNIKMSSLVIWLKNFVPSLLDDNPFFIDHFVKWTVERVFQLEQSGYWPKIGLKFIEELISVLELSLKTVTIRPISMDELDILKDRINYIMELKERYRINMLLAELSSQSPSEVALIMLRRCYTEDLELFLQDYLPTYAARHIFELDDTLRTYIENEAAVSGGGVDGFRLKLILNVFRLNTNKLECLLQVLKVLDVPWDANVLDLAVSAAASPSKDFTITDVDRAIALEIQKELKYAKVKMILKKYNFPLICTDYMLVINKIISTPNVNLEDLKDITTAMTNYRCYGNILYIDKCLHDCETKIGLNYFQSLSYKEKKISLKAVINKYEQIINSKKNDFLIEKNYLDFLKGTNLLSEHQIADIENLYHLKNSYNIIMTINNFYNENYCYNQTNAWMSLDNGTVSSTRGECISQLTRTRQSRNSILANLLRQTSSSDSVRKFIEILVGTPTNTNEKSLIFSCFKDGSNQVLLLNSFNTLVDIISKCDENYVHTLTQYLVLLNALLNCNIMLKHLSVAWKFQYIYLPMSSIGGMNTLLTFFDNISPFNGSKDDVYNTLDGYDFIPVKIISLMLANSFVRGQSVTDDFYIMRDKFVRKLFTKVIACHELDEILITCLLMILYKYDEINNSSELVDILRGQNDVIAPNVMSYISAPLIRRTFVLDSNLPENTVPYPPHHILKSKFNINLADIALPENSEETWDVKVVLFCVLRQYPNTSFERLVELCRTLNVSINDGLTLQMTSLLSTWDLKYKLFYDDLNCRQIIFDNDHNTLMSKCLIIWENIKHKDIMREILTDFWKNGEVSLHGRSVSINPYYYEIYICIYHLLFGASMEVRNVKEFLLLNFLKDYRRKSPPKQYEFELFSVKGMFPEVGYYRLPFHLFLRDDMWSNLKSEITLETYERWLPVVGLLSLDADIQTARDMICSNALKQTMTSRKRLQGADLEEAENEPWRLITREEPLLRAAHKCVRHIANMEWAGACLFYVLQGCARGADQVAAAQLCYQFAQRWASVQPGNRAVRQMERLHSSLSTRHALHKIGWACEELVRLSTEPAQLIRALYLHPGFVNKMCRHDVNRAANEIADKNGINISSIRIQILENILEKFNEENKSNKKVSGLTSSELLTAKYILKATCPKMGAIYLSRIAFDDESDFNKCKKLRALQCLMSIIEADTAVKVTNREREALWNSLLELIHVVNLENIDMPWVVATFMQDKIKAIEQLLQGDNNVESLKVAAELCRKYGNVKIIHSIIPLLLRVGLYEEMAPLLLKISAPPNEIIYAAWRAVILSPFQRADYPITERQKIKCINAINLLPVCPVIKDEDLLEIWKNCVRCKCYGVGCLVLPYMTSENRQYLDDLKKIDKRNLIASLKNLHAETYLISGAMHVVENMLSKSHRLAM